MTLVIIEDYSTVTYQDACEARATAETSCDPYLYHQAANYFAVLGMESAAQRCRDRARHYLGNEISKIPNSVSAYTNY